MSELKEYLDKLVKKYETEDFIKDDPVQFPHKFDILQDIEISGFISSALAYGRREAFIEKLEFLHKILGRYPYEFCMNYNLKKDFKYLENFVYRFNKGIDISNLILSLQNFYGKYGSMKAFCENLYEDKPDIKGVIAGFTDELTNKISEKSEGYSYLIVSPKLNSPCKRINLFFRWMVRKSEVDIGIWNKIDKKDLIIPLDTHVAKMSRNLNLVNRSSNDWKTAEIITSNLKKFDASDPVKYDFALFGLGIENISLKTKVLLER